MNCTVPVNPNPLPEDVPKAQRPQACNNYMRFFEQSQLPALSTLATKACNIENLLTFNNYTGEGLPVTVPTATTRKYNNKEVVKVGNSFYVSTADNNPLTEDGAGNIIGNWEKLPDFSGNESGSNANGSWTKFSDGTIIYQIIKQLGLNTNGFVEVTVPIVSVGGLYPSIGFEPNAKVGANAPWQNAWKDIHVLYQSATNKLYVRYSGAIDASVIGDSYITAVGRWK